MKKRRTGREKEIDDSIRRIVEEMGMNLPELVGRFIANCQVLEARLKRYITTVDKKITLNSKATLGTLIGMFTARYKTGLLPSTEEQLFMQSLPSVLELRNDVAHEFFLYDAASRREVGDRIHALNKKVIRKGLRMTESCMHQLDVILKAVEAEKSKNNR